MAIARARILQWPFAVWPLSKTEKAREVAQAIAGLGELKILGVEMGHIGYVKLWLCSGGPKEGHYYVNIRPVHFGTRDSFELFDFSMLRFVEFTYSHRSVTTDGRHSWDPSSYLTIANVR